MPTSFFAQLRSALPSASVGGVLLAVGCLVVGIIDISGAVAAVAFAAIAAVGTILLEDQWA